MSVLRSGCAGMSGDYSIPRALQVPREFDAATDPEFEVDLVVQREAVTSAVSGARCHSFGPPNSSMPSSSPLTLEAERESSGYVDVAEVMDCSSFDFRAGILLLGAFATWFGGAGISSLVGAESSARFSRFEQIMMAMIGIVMLISAVERLRKIPTSRKIRYMSIFTMIMSGLNDDTEWIRVTAPKAIALLDKQKASSMALYRDLHAKHAALIQVKQLSIGDGHIICGRSFSAAPPDPTSNGRYEG